MVPLSIHPPQIDTVDTDADVLGYLAWPTAPPEQPSKQ